MCPIYIVISCKTRIYFIFIFENIFRKDDPRDEDDTQATYIYFLHEPHLNIYILQDTYIYFIFILENIFRKDEDELETGICTFSPEAKLVCNKNVKKQKNKN